MIEAEVFVTPVILMIDTGCELNLIKENNILFNKEIDRSQITKLKGITKNHVFTLGRIATEFREAKYTFML